MEWSEHAEKGIPDMIEIDELNHATILWNLHQRYMQDDIYTYVGPTLLAVNPYKNMSHKFPPSCKDTYKEIMEANDYYGVLKKLDPHTFAIAAYAHKSMIVTK